MMASSGWENSLLSPSLRWLFKNKGLSFFFLRKDEETLGYGKTNITGPRGDDEWLYCIVDWGKGIWYFFVSLTTTSVLSLGNRKLAPLHFLPRTYTDQTLRVLSLLSFFPSHVYSLVLFSCPCTQVRRAHRSPPPPVITKGSERWGVKRDGRERNTRRE